jgi:hypothetical protein
VVLAQREDESLLESPEDKGTGHSEADRGVHAVPGFGKAQCGPDYRDHEQNKAQQSEHSRLGQLEEVHIVDGVVSEDQSVVVVVR